MTYVIKNSLGRTNNAVESVKNLKSRESTTATTSSGLFLFSIRLGLEDNGFFVVAQLVTFVFRKSY